MPAKTLLLLSVAAFVTGCTTPATTSSPTTTAPPIVAPTASTSTPMQGTTTQPTTPPPDDLVGKPAPDFTAADQNGTPFHLAAWKGKRVVLYFYPKDETPGCTKEACSFRDAWQSLSKTGAVLVGVSADTTASHKEFAAHHQLPFLLVSDPDGKIAGRYGVPFAVFHQRQTVVIGADGNILKVYRKVDVAAHASQILDDLTAP